MNRIFLALVAPAVLALGACSGSENAPSADTQPSSFGDSISYFLGRTAGAQLFNEYLQMPDDQKARFNSSDFIAGLSTVLAADSLSTSYIAGLTQALQLAQMTLQMRQAGIEVSPALFVAQLKECLQADSLSEQTVQSDLDIVEVLDSRAKAIIQQAALEKINENKLKAEKFLAEKRKANPAITVTPSGLTIDVARQGTAAVHEAGEVVPAIFTATTLSGKEILSTGGKPQPVNTRTTYPGLAEALTTLPAGTVATVYVPASLAFGDQGSPDGLVLPGELIIIQLEIID